MTKILLTTISIDLVDSTEVRKYFRFFVFFFSLQMNCFFKLNIFRREKATTIKMSLNTYYEKENFKCYDWRSLLQ